MSLTLPGGVQSQAAAQVSPHCLVSADIIRRSGILRGHDSSTGSSNGSEQATSAPHDLQEAVDHAMRRLASYLLSGNT